MPADLRCSPGRQRSFWRRESGSLRRCRRPGATPLDSRAACSKARAPRSGSSRRASRADDRPPTDPPFRRIRSPPNRERHRSARAPHEPCSWSTSDPQTVCRADPVSRQLAADYLCQAANKIHPARGGYRAGCVIKARIATPAAPMRSAPRRPMIGFKAKVVRPGSSDAASSASGWMSAGGFAARASSAPLTEKGERPPRQRGSRRSTPVLPPLRSPAYSWFSSRLAYRPAA